MMATKMPPKVIKVQTGTDIDSILTYSEEVHGHIEWYLHASGALVIELAGNPCIAFADGQWLGVWVEMASVEPEPKQGHISVNVDPVVAKSFSDQIKEALDKLSATDPAYTGPAGQ